MLKSIKKISPAVKIATVSIAMILILGGCQSKAAGNTENTATAKSNASDVLALLPPKNAITEKCSIEGMTCTSCAYGAEALLVEIDGVYDAQISYDDSAGEITYDPSKVSQEELKEALLPYKLNFL